MESEILLYSASYFAARLAILLAFGYVLFRLLRPSHAAQRSTHGRTSAVRRANRVPEDRC